TKPVSEFGKNATNKDGLGYYCRQCISREAKAWYKKNKEAKSEYYVANKDRFKKNAIAWNEKNPGYHRRNKYNISQEEYLELLNAQGGVCAICGETNKNGRTLAVDHNHNCCPGEKTCGDCIRQLLCSSCNSGLGFFRDD